MVGIKKLGCLGVLSRKTSKNPKRMNLTRRVSGRTHIYFASSHLFPIKRNRCDLCALLLLRTTTLAKRVGREEGVKHKRGFVFLGGSDRVRWWGLLG